MNKVLLVAWREFSSVVFTKGFVIGVLMTPVMILIVLGAMVLMKNAGGPRVSGRVAVIDRSGLVSPLIEGKFTEEAIEAEADRTAREADEVIDEKMGSFPLSEDQKAMAKQAAGARIREQIKGPRLTLERLPDDADAEREKQDVARTRIRAAGKGEPVSSDRLALAVIPTGAVSTPPGEAFAPLEFYHADGLDFQVVEIIQRRVRAAVVDARLANDPRVAAGGLSAADVRRLMDAPRATVTEMTPQGEKQSIGAAAMILPMAFMALLFIAVMTSGQYLLTSTVEEKGTRVMEVLLSALSPMQLLTGKIVGQMGVGLLILLVYSGMGIAALVIFSVQHLIEPMGLVYLFIFFLIAYFLVASMMAAIGSAVSDMREAQTLMTPVMLVLMVPWLIWFLIQRTPNSPLAVVLSFLPGTNPFVMVMRLSGSEPVPAWQIPVAILVGVLSVIVAAWAAAKIFRIGALLHGKPPNLATLIRWVRMA